MIRPSEKWVVGDASFKLRPPFRLTGWLHSDRTISSKRRSIKKKETDERIDPVYLGLNLYRFVRDYFERLRLEVHRTELLSRVQGGEFLCLDGFIRVIHPNKLSLGKHVYIGGNAYMNCAGGIHIGDGAILEPERYGLLV